MHRNAFSPDAETKPGISVVIPTYRRGPVLLETLRHLFALNPPPGEILVVDQTESPDAEVRAALDRWTAEGRIRRIPVSPPSIPRAMNAGLKDAQGTVVLFLDDDVVPQKDLVACHQNAYAEHREAWAVAGQVIQPEDANRFTRVRPGTATSGGSFLEKDLHFDFGGKSPGRVTNVMACHLSVKRQEAMEIGGFDENFIPPVSFRFETEFAKRLAAAGGKIFFDPRASLRHLRESSGGTRTRGGHLTSASPVHGAGAYYYMLRWGRGWNRIGHILKRPFREVCTKFHLTHPWFIPVKFIGELRAIRLAVRLYRQGPRLMQPEGSHTS